jgi:DNA-binding NtrC family response regulator
LNVIPIVLPSLRERRDDIPLIVANYIRTKINAPSGQTFGLTRQVMDALRAYDWPGNVRELENVLQRACALCEKNIAQLSDLPAALQECVPQNSASGSETITTFSQRLAAESVYPLANPAGPDIHPAQAKAGSTGGGVESLKEFLREQESAYLNRPLARTGGDKEKTAGLLGISLATLYRKLSGEDSPSQ